MVVPVPTLPVDRVAATGTAGSGSVPVVTNPAEGAQGRRRTPPAVTALAALLVLEAGLLLGAGGWLGYELFTQDATSAGAGVMLLLLALGIGVALLAAARGLLRGRRWPRGLALTWQILQLSVAWGTFRGGPLWLAVVLLVPCLAVGVGLFLPVVLRWTTPPRRG